MNEVKFEVKSGKNIIRGFMLGDTDKKKGAVILSHGFLADYHMCEGYARALTEAGYLTFLFDFCGGGPGPISTGATSEMSVVTETRDLNAVYEYVSSLEYVDSDNITLLGCSQGGFVSGLLAKQLGNKIKNLIMFYPALCIPDDARRGDMNLAKFDPENIPDLIECGPMTLGRIYVDDVINMDAFEELKGYSGRVLLIHGTVDSLVNVSYSRKARELYTNCVYQEIEGADHVFFNEHYEQSVNQLLDFMR